LGCLSYSPQPNQQLAPTLITAEKLSGLYTSSVVPLSHHVFLSYTTSTVPTLSVIRNSEKFPDVPVPHKKTLHKYVKRFWITGSILDSTRTCRRYMLSEEQLDDRNLRMIHLQENHLFSWTTKMGMSAPSVQYEQNCCIFIHIRQEWFTYSTTRITT